MLLFSPLGSSDSEGNFETPEADTPTRTPPEPGAPRTPGKEEWALATRPLAPAPWHRTLRPRRRWGAAGLHP